MQSPIACVTGTDRGVGLALTRLLLEQGGTVFAGGIVRGNESIAELKALYPERLHNFYVDIGDDRSVKEAAAFVQSRTDRLDLLLNNAAILGETERTIYENLDFDDMLRNYNITALGAIRMTNALIEPIMSGGKLIVNISSEAGSIMQSYREAWFGYCMAKAALNMGSTIIHTRIKGEGGRVMLFHPGWVQSMITGVFSSEAMYTPEQAAAHILRRIEERGQEIHEQPLYLEADTGRLLPW
ncbi:SDR family NAD(P)-dependent oxidoreductase [Paenibacillus sp.]|uniref:SDR family NAD(P)-dependent oxidoreductase n=1 Tax=Paenibacillus sp. TaxID=58172 RepID=UPI002D2CA3A4|nr:SDR family NAD(P)-dependent oxidoreductase [Paenibacillus sp.]HZG57790.1 SDR family NAD(P)-dependent oxidoreductase [Paenibacillus sp.]